jgi:hypothetical protein
LLHACTLFFKAHAEADSFFAFTLLMADVRDHFVRSLDMDESIGIRATMNELCNRLKTLSPTLWEDMVSHP